MRKKRKELKHSFSPVVLYLEDLEKIEHWFKETSWKLNIETENFVFESIEELKKQIVEKEQKACLTTLHFEADKPPNYARLYFNQSLGGSIEFYEDTNESRGILSRIQILLKDRKRGFLLNYKYILPTFFLGLLFSGIFIFISLFLGTEILLKKIVVVIGWAIPLLFWSWFGWSWKINFSEGTLIFLKRKEQTSFWQRNKEKIFWRIIVPVIAACLGGILGAFFTHLLNK